MNINIGKFKIIDILIIILLVLCIIFGVRLGLTVKNINNEEYNTIITDFAIELVKGNKSLEDIDSLEIDETIKDSFREYYNSSFYNTSDTVVIFDSVSKLDNAYESIKEVSNHCYVDGIFNKELFENYLYENGLITIDATSEEDIEDIDYEEDSDKYFYSIYNPNLKSDIEYEVKNDNLVVKVMDLTFDDSGSCNVNYKGFNIRVVRDALEKGLRHEIRNSSKYISISLTNDTFVDNIRRQYYEDFLDNRYLITYSTLPSTMLQRYSSKPQCRTSRKSTAPYSATTKPQRHLNARSPFQAIRFSPLQKNTSVTAPQRVLKAV